MAELYLLIGLGTVMGLVLVLPFTVRWVEEELEVFLLVMGALTITMSGLWSSHLVLEALEEPIKISLAVLGFGVVFRAIRPVILRRVGGLADRLGSRLFVFLLVVVLGLLSSVITAIIAALVLVEVISGLNWTRDRERIVVILTCYSIGLGAVLTPIGEPLATIAIAKLSGPPYHADFFFLARLLWPWVLGGIAVLGALAVALAGRGGSEKAEGMTEDRPDTMKDILMRAGKVYVFVAALVLLGRGFGPIVDRYLVEMPKEILFWVNSVSMALDNATLAAAEITPSMGLDQIEFLLMGLLISGGMMIPGNIPNIIAAAKLNIKSGDWAKFALPLGAILMAVYFILLRL